MLVQYFDWRNGGLQFKIIEFNNKPNETADIIAEYVHNTIEKSVLHSQGTIATQCLEDWGVMNMATMCLRS